MSMSRTARFGVSGVVCLGLFAALAVALALIVFPSGGQSITSPPTGNFYRLTSAYSVDESSTTTEQTLWQRTLTAPGGYRTAYVTVSGQSDDHNGAVQSLGCQFN